MGGGTVKLPPLLCTRNGVWLAASNTGWAENSRELVPSASPRKRIVASTQLPVKEEPTRVPAQVMVPRGIIRLNGGGNE